MSSTNTNISRADHDLAIQETVARYEDKIDYLKYQIEKLTAHIYGARSEKQRYLDSTLVQGNLFEEELPPKPIKEEKELVKEHERRKPNKARFPKNAERKINNLELAESERICPCCGKVQSYFGYESSEKAHIVPAKCIIREDRRFKYSCGSCKEGGVSIAVVAKSAFPKTRITTETRVQFLVSKFTDHIPYYRQSKILERQGVHLADSSIVHYGMESASALDPIVLCMLDEVVSSNYIQADETTLRVLLSGKDKKEKPGSHQGYLWAYAIPHGSVVFLYSRGRNKENPSGVLSNFKGVLQTDRYSGYHETQAKEYIIDVACWAHARRKFVEAGKYSNKRAGPIIKLIGQLYKVEKRAREESLSWPQRALLRKQESLPILSQLKIEIEQLGLKTLPSTPLGEAIGYALRSWDALTRYADHGHVEIDNNLIENSMRPIAIGRKNYMFAGSEGGAEACSTNYSITESCRRLGVNPTEYLCYVFEELAGIEEGDSEAYRRLTPARYAAEKANQSS